MALLAAPVNLNRHEEDVDREKYEELLEDVLLVVGEVKYEGAVKVRLLLRRVAVDELDMVVQFLGNSIVVLPLTRVEISVTRHQRNIPESRLVQVVDNECKLTLCNHI